MVAVLFSLWFTALFSLPGPAHCAFEDAPIVWSGGVSPDSFAVRAVIARGVFDRSGGTGGLTLRVSPRENGGANEFFFSPSEVSTVTDVAGSVRFEGSRVVTFEPSGLEPWTWYAYSVSAGPRNETVAGTSGSARTAPPDGVDVGWTVAMGSCASTGSDARVFEALADSGADHFFHLGDMFYEDIGEDSVEAFLDAYADSHASTTQRRAYLSMPVTYMYDDHDFGPNNAGSNSPSRGAVVPLHRAVSPAHLRPVLPESEGNAVSFRLGTSVFLVLDVRAGRYDGAVLGDGQETWLIDAISALGKQVAASAAAAAAAANVTLASSASSSASALFSSSTSRVFIVSGVPWIASWGSDTWHGAHEQRARIADAIAAAGMAERVVLLAGDMHAAAFDDGSHSNYAGGVEYGAPGGFPVFHASPLDRPTSTKGGPYSHGCYDTRGQFGTVSYTPSADDTIGCVLFRVHDAEGDQVFSYDTCDPPLEGDLCRPVDLVRLYTIAGAVVGAVIFLLIGACIVCCARSKRCCGGRKGSRPVDTENAVELTHATTGLENNNNDFIGSTAYHGRIDEITSINSSAVYEVTETSEINGSGASVRSEQSHASSSHDDGTTSDSS